MCLWCWWCGAYGLGCGGGGFLYFVFFLIVGGFLGRFELGENRQGVDGGKRGGNLLEGWEEGREKYFYR